MVFLKFNARFEVLFLLKMAFYLHLFTVAECLSVKRIYVKIGNIAVFNDAVIPKISDYKTNACIRVIRKPSTVILRCMRCFLAIESLVTMKL